MIAKLRSYHAASQVAMKDDLKRKKYKNYGFDLINGKVVNEISAGVLEPTMSKIKSLKFAMEACISILRIDTMITVAPEPKKEDHDH